MATSSSITSSRQAFRFSATRANEQEDGGGGKAAPQIQPRGVTPKDKVGELTERRRGELEKAEARQLKMDRCMWTALRRDFTTAEQFATQNFQNTVIFEPWGAGDGVTKHSANKRGPTANH